MTSAFQYLNDGWEPYLGAKVGNIYSKSKDEWNRTYEARGMVRAKKDQG
jgi:hypothetical protein